MYGWDDLAKFGSMAAKKVGGFVAGQEFSGDAGKLFMANSSALVNSVKRDFRLGSISGLAKDLGNLHKDLMIGGAIRGAMIGAGVNVAQNSYGNITHHRGAMRGTLGSAVRGGIGGGALGAVAGLGGGLSSNMGSFWKEKALTNSAHKISI